MPKILVTGASGKLGRHFVDIAGGGYELRLTYHSHPFEAPPHETIAMDLTDMDSVRAAVAGVDTVVHLGASAHDTSPWKAVLPDNIIGTYHVFEAAREAGVRRVIFASSNHAVGMGLHDKMPLGLDAEMRPTTLYGITKCYGEAMGRYYHDRYGIEVICLRIGGCAGENTREGQLARIQRSLDAEGRWPYTLEQWLAIYLSPRDWAQLLSLAIDVDLDWGVFYGCSDNIPADFDLTETKRVLGYRPQDSVQDLLHELGVGAAPIAENMTQSVSNISYDEGALRNTPKRRPTMEAEIVNRETIQVLGVQERIDPQAADYGAIWGQKYDPRQAEIGALANKEGFFGIYYDYGEPPMCEFLAGQAVGPVEAVPEGLVLREVPGGQYAKFVCTMKDIGMTWGRIMAEWMPTAAYAVDESRPSIEWYAPTDDQANGETHIYMAIQAK